MIITNKNEKINHIYYKQIFEEKNKAYSIIHLITANEFSEAVKYYNSFFNRFIKTKFKSIYKFDFFFIEKYNYRNLYRFYKKYITRDFR